MSAHRETNQTMTTKEGKPVASQNNQKTLLQVVPPVADDQPIPLKKIVPKGSIRVVFWGLRIYIVAMLVLVIVGFAHGLH